ncbi:MAG: DNA alkylation repair protein, partial [Verrucomicrobiota bacterium]
HVYGDSTAGQPARFGLQHFGAAVYLRLVHHRSDLVRGWAAYVLSAATDFSVGERLRIIRSLAGDHNAAVRDWAWLSMRPHVAADVPHTLALLQPWTAESSPFLRRFASEITRPRGVWCQPLRELEREPEIALPLLEALRADPHRYVQNSVAHWLGDAARTQRSWVESLCARWKKESPGEATQWICRRSMRLAS